MIVRRALGAIFLVVTVRVLSLFASYGKVEECEDCTGHPSTADTRRVAFALFREQRTALPNGHTGWGTSLFERWIRFVDKEVTSTPEAVLQLGKDCKGKPALAKCKLAVCVAVFREEPYLEEWLQYHLLLGVEHFYVTILGARGHAQLPSLNATAEILKPFVERGQVTVSKGSSLYKIPSLMEQISALHKCFKMYATRTEWLVTFDPDEYYFSRQYPTFQHLVQGAERNGTNLVPLPWYTFGSSGHIERPSGPLFSAYHRRTRNLVYEADHSRFYARRNGKVLFRAECYNGLPNTHKITLKPVCNVSGKVNSFTINGTDYHLKHYQVKSLEDWLWKRGANGFTGFRTTDNRGYWNSLLRNWTAEFERASQLFDEVEDHDMLVYSRALGALHTLPTRLPAGGLGRVNINDWLSKRKAWGAAEFANFLGLPYGLRRR